MTCDWTRTGCSHPVGMPGFIGFCSTVWVPHICQRTLRENQTDRQTDSQLDRKWSSKGVRGCSRWFMLCSGMLNEFRILCCYGNCLNGRCLLSLWRIRMLQTAIVKMSKHDIIALRFISHMELPTIERQTEKEMNHCVAPFWISCQCFYSLRPETELGNLLAVGCQAKVKNSDMHHCSAELLKQKFLRLTSTSDMTLSTCASLRGLCASVSIQLHAYGLQITQTSGSHGPFLSLFMLLSKTFSLCFCLCQSVAFEVLSSG